MAVCKTRCVAGLNEGAIDASLCPAHTHCYLQLGIGMTSIPHCIRVLEAYIERSGARLVRGTLPECIQGRVDFDLITLRADLSPREEFLTLVHELTHWLVHRDARSPMDCTLFEYEAEAVEALVMVRLDLPDASHPGVFDRASATDNLLLASVARVKCASARICGALGVDPETRVRDAGPHRPRGSDR